MRRRPQPIAPTTVEDQLRVLPLAPPGSVRHERRRAHGEHLRHGEHDGHQIPRDADRGDRLFAKTPDPVEIGEEIERLENHRHQHEAGGFEQVIRDGA